MSKSFNKGLRKFDVAEYGFERRPVLKRVAHQKWSEKIVQKKHRKIVLNRERTNKYYDIPVFASVVVPHLFLPYWPPSVSDIITCQSAFPPILEGCVKDEFMWWLKKL